jgi:hypothetical protein
LSSITTVAALTSFVVVSDCVSLSAAAVEAGKRRRAIPLLYAGTATSYLVLAAPLGRLADRVGRPAVFLFGQACMVLVYAGVAALDIGLWTLGLVLLLHGAYYAATDGVIAALISGSDAGRGSRERACRAEYRNEPDTPRWIGDRGRDLELARTGNRGHDRFDGRGGDSDRERNRAEGRRQIDRGRHPRE